MLLRNILAPALLTALCLAGSKHDLDSAMNFIASRVRITHLHDSSVLSANLANTTDKTVVSASVDGCVLSYEEQDKDTTYHGNEMSSQTNESRHVRSFRLDLSEITKNGISAGGCYSRSGTQCVSLRFNNPIKVAVKFLGGQESIRVYTDPPWSKVTQLAEPDTEEELLEISILVNSDASDRLLKAFKDATRLCGGG